MLDLPDVTLVMIETLEHELAQLAILDCLNKARFGDVLIFTDLPDRFEGLGRVIPVPNWPSKIGWSRFSWHGVPPHVRTRQTLYIQWDAWIWDPGMWRDEYLDYDIVGAPWWYKDGKNVGNLGFAIRSKRLIQYLYNNQGKFPVTTDADDDLLCRKYRPQLEDAGFVWAPECVARDFAFECVRPTPDSRHFGFHAAFNFNEVLEPAALMKRASLMFKSPYIKRTSHIWKAFEQKNPDIIKQLQQESTNGQHCLPGPEVDAGLVARRRSRNAAPRTVRRPKSRNAHVGHRVRGPG